MLRYNVFIKVTPQKREELLRVVNELVINSQKEEGCLMYELYENKSNPQVLMLCETWTSQEAVDKHTDTEHFKTNAPLMEELAQVLIEKFQF